MNRHMQHGPGGFTLVELAIVMTIIGLLIGGILKGQELMENARVTATAAQVKAYEAATTTFRDMYAAYPGDMIGAQTRLVGCTPGCNPATTAATMAGNSVVGDPTWSTTLAWANQGTGVQGTTGTTPPTMVGSETYLFWTHLLLANLINGVTADSVNSPANYAWGSTHPAAKIGGGFIVGYGTGTIAPGSLQPAGTGLAGTIVALTMVPNAALPTASSTLPLTPLRAAQIDRKMDDGRPGTGYVQAFGVGASCFTTAAAGATQYTYQESIGTKDCGLLFRIES